MIVGYINFVSQDNEWDIEQKTEIFIRSPIFNIPDIGMFTEFFPYIFNIICSEKKFKRISLPDHFRIETKQVCSASLQRIIKYVCINK